MCLEALLCLRASLVNGIAYFSCMIVVSIEQRVKDEHRDAALEPRNHFSGSLNVSVG